MIRGSEPRQHRDNGVPTPAIEATGNLRVSAPQPDNEERIRRKNGIQAQRDVEGLSVYFTTGRGEWPPISTIPRVFGNLRIWHSNCYLLGMNDFMDPVKEYNLRAKGV